MKHHRSTYRIGYDEAWNEAREHYIPLLAEVRAEEKEVSALCDRLAEALRKFLRIHGHEQFHQCSVCSPVYELLAEYDKRRTDEP